jgi:hypothetical protein
MWWMLASEGTNGIAVIHLRATSDGTTMAKAMLDTCFVGIQVVCSLLVGNICFWSKFPEMWHPYTAYLRVAFPGVLSKAALGDRSILDTTSFYSLDAPASMSKDYFFL